MAQRLPLPGVRDASKRGPWPKVSLSKAVSTSGVNGGDYVTTRRALLSRYVLPWLQAVQVGDSKEYLITIFQVCYELSMESLPLEEKVWAHCLMIE